MVAILSRFPYYLELHTIPFSSATSTDYRLQRNPVAGAGRPFSLLA
jgi:hypothetical protein